ncbi:hypothetical protein DH2020_031636 [Rehmannia glutinosa]|uniref:Uncharacterized protein n=1 Tax=Rehmannia glutinosa TaxID=99300 RepID=A0ABR0VJU8_REHGL
MANFRFVLAILVVAFAAMAMVAQSGDYSTFDAAAAHMAEPDGHGMVADALDFDEEMMMESETARRQLGGRGYISYGAMKRNSVPCNQRGQSYYNCRGHQKANPYKRGCTRATS